MKKPTPVMFTYDSLTFLKTRNVWQLLSKAQQEQCTIALKMSWREAVIASRKGEIVHFEIRDKKPLQKEFHAWSPNTSTKTPSMSRH